MSIKTELINYLESIGVDRKTAMDEKLFSSGTIDSIDIIGLLVFIENTYGVNFNPFDIGLHDFDTVDLIVSTIEKSRIARD